MADYFLGTWGGGKAKVFHFPKRLIRKLGLPPSRGEDRMVPIQPLVLEGCGNNVRYNLRKINELPWHLTHSGRIEEFYDYIVFNFSFLLTKMQGTSRFELLRDLRLPSDSGIECIKEVDFVYNAIRLAAHTLVHDPSNLVVDLLGRLVKYEEDNPRVHLLLQQCRKDGPEHCCLLPTLQSFESGSDTLSTSFDVGLSMGIVLANGLIAVISLVDTEVELYDVEGNLIRSNRYRYNIFLGIKFLLRHSPLRDAEYNMVVYGPLNLADPNDADAKTEEAVEEAGDRVCESQNVTGAEGGKEEEAESSKDAGNEKDVDSKMKEEASSTKERKTMEEEEKEEEELDAVEEGGSGATADGEEEEDYEKEKEDKPEKEKECQDDEKEKDEAEEEEEEESDDNDNDESKRPVDVISVNLETGALKHLWRLTGKDRKNVTLDDVDFVGKKYFVTIPKRYYTDINVFSIEEKCRVLSVENVLLWASDITYDERMLIWCRHIPSSEEECNTICVRNMDSGLEYEHVSSLDKVWTALWFVFLDDEVCLFWVKDNDKRQPFLQVFKTDKLLSENDEGRFEIVHEVQLKGHDYWKQFPSSQGIGNQEMMRNRFSNSDKTMCVILYNNRCQLPGFVWKKLSREWIALDCSSLEDDELKCYSKSWADGTQASFPSNGKCLLTTGTKIMMLVWSLTDGRLIRVIKFGTAEALLGGEIDGRFILFHFPDESQGDTEKMFIMAKFYNIDAICKEDETMGADSAGKTNMPIFRVKKAGGGSLYVSQESPNILVYDCKEDGIIYDVDACRTLYRGPFPSPVPEDADLPAEFQKYVQTERDLIRVDMNNAGTKGQSESRAGEVSEPTAEQPEPSSDDVTSWYMSSCGKCKFKDKIYKDSIVIKKSGSAQKWADTFDRTHIKGFVDVDMGMAIFLEPFQKKITFTSSEFADSDGKQQEESRTLVQTISYEDFESPWSSNKFSIDETLLKDWRQKIGFSDESATFVVKHAYKRPDHSGQALVTVVLESKWLDMTKLGKPLLWPGHVDIVNYADFDSSKDPSEVISYGPMFDCGPYLLFLNDGLHVVTYRLHIYNFVTGEKMREIVPDSPDFLFTNFLLSADEEYVFGFVIRRPYKVEFEIEETYDDEETFAEDSPRKFQIYRLCDGRRIANYVFEVDPADIIVTNNGRNLIVATHNEELHMFNLVFPDKNPFICGIDA